MLTDLLGTLPLKDLSLGGVVFIVIIMVLTDRLVTRQRLLDEREEKERYRVAVENLQTAFNKLSDSAAKQVIVTEAINQTLTQIQMMALRNQREA